MTKENKIKKKSPPFNINSRVSRKEYKKVEKRQGKKKRGRTPTDGSSASKEMAGTTYSLRFRKIRELQDDPYTKHPLSFEEFDNIPDIGDLTEENNG